MTDYTEISKEAGTVKDKIHTIILKKVIFHAPCYNVSTKKINMRYEKMIQIIITIRFKSL